MRILKTVGKVTKWSVIAGVGVFVSAVGARACLERAGYTTAD